MKNKIAISFLLTAAVSISLHSVSAQDNFVSQNPENVNPVDTISTQPPRTGPCASGCTPTIPTCPPEGQGVVTWRGGGVWLWSTYFPGGMFPMNNYTVRSLVLASDQPAGWYSVYQDPNTWIADSGPHQRNESTFLSVPNGFNPKGKPNPASLTDQNRCHGFAIMRDADNEFPIGPDGHTINPPDIPHIFAGTFYLTPGNNWATVSMFCKLKNIMAGEPGCEGIEDTGINNDANHEDFGQTTLCHETPPPTTGYGGHWGTVQSIGYNLNAVCAIPEAGLQAPDPQPVPEPVLNDNFTGSVLQDDWVATYESDSDLNSIAYHQGIEWISGLEIPNHNPNLAGAGTPFSGQWSADDSNNLFSVNTPGKDRPSMVILESEGPSFIHYVPNDVDEEFYELSWKNYVYTGVFRHRNFNGDGSTAITDPLPRSFGPTVYSEFPYNPTAYALRSTDGGSFILDGINMTPGHYLGFRPGQSGFNDSHKDTGIVPRRGVWYAFKIDARTIPTGVYIRAKIWESNVLDAYVPAGGADPTWADIATEEPNDYQAHIRSNVTSRLGTGVVGMEFTDGRGGMHVDYLRVRPTTDVYPDYDPWNWQPTDWP